MKKANYSIPFKKTGTILNFLFIINWIFLLMFFLDAKKYQKSLTGGYFIATLVIPLATLLFLSLYFLIIWSISKNYQQQKQKIILYTILISVFAILSILSTLLILIALNGKLLILAFSLSLTFSIVFGIIAIILDTNFMINRIKWDHMLVGNNQENDVIDIVNDGDVVDENK